MATSKTILEREERERERERERKRVGKAERERELLHSDEVLKNMKAELEVPHSEIKFDLD